MELRELTNTDNAITYIPVELLNGKKIGIRKWRIKEEKELLFALEDVNDINIGRKEIFQFIRRCVDNPLLFDSLSNTNVVYLLMQLRKRSKGNVKEFSINCSKCNLELTDCIDITNDTVIKKFDVTPLKINKDLTIGIKEVNFSEYEKLKETYTKQTEFSYWYVIKSIAYISYKENVIENFSEDELVEFLDYNTESSDFELIERKVINALPEVKINKNIKCGKCNNDNEVIFTSEGVLYSFFIF